ncbi:hypothetical protein V7S43_013403 [Phytophthora oleae]|uniref:AAA+ ATPase domain-containing protein n=1 Tax=Phytophthora oleae TaxID=2107226 RepID=A0ABD3F812_9STRA
MPFVVLENSSGTGKTQMAFNLQANGAFDVFYLPCTPSTDVNQDVYEAFTSRQIAFQDCIESDMANMKGDGSVSDFGRVGDTKRLKVYAFIIVALRGAKTFMGDALLEDVIAARNGRNKPIVFFLDEFPRLGNHLAGDDRNARKNLARSMRNVFRSLRLPLIISATNGTARNLFTVSDYSRPSSGNPVPWCMVVPSLPMFATEGSATSVFKWIIRHSRPRFGALAQKHMDKFPYDGQDQLGYLTTMAKALTPKFRALKGAKRENEFENGQLYLFLGASYNVDDEHKNWGMSDDENDEDYVPEDDDDDESKEDPDEEMPEARSGSDESSNKEVNLVDGHYGRMEEQEIFELQLGIRNLKKDEKYWKCRCIFPQLNDDILLFLTLMEDYEDTKPWSKAPQGSVRQRRLAFPNNKWSPLDRPFYKKLRDVLGKSGATLEALAAGAVVLASHQGGFYGVNFKAFFGRLLYELGVRGSNEPVAFPPRHNEMENFTIPFLSPPNVAWPGEFLAFWENTRAQFATMRRSRNGDRIEFQTHSGALTGKCKDRKQFTLKVLKYVLEVIPPATKIHLVVVKRLQGKYFTRASESESANFPLESVAEPKDAASAKTPASSKTKKPKAGRKNESAFKFWERIELQHAKFYRTSRRGSLEDFPELMQARRDPSRDETSSSAGGNMESDGGAGKTIIFIEVGNWKYR